MPFALAMLKVSAAAGLLGLDATAALQVMVSRPLVAGGVAGWIAGDLASGLALASLVELLWMRDLPVGSSVPPDGTLAGIFAGAGAALLPDLVPGADPYALGSLVLLASVPAGMVGVRFEIAQRQACGGLSRWAEKRVTLGDGSALGRAMLAALGLAYIRGFAAAMLVLSVGIPALALLMEHLPSDGIDALRWGYWLAWLLGMMVAADHFWDRRNLKFAGLALLAVSVAGANGAHTQWSLLGLALGLAVVLGLWRWARSRAEQSAGERS